MTPPNIIQTVGKSRRLPLLQTNKPYNMTIQTKAFEQYFYFGTAYYAVRGALLKYADESLVCNHSNESYWAVLSCGAVYYAVQGGSNF